jgi:hypothetical protein
MGGNEEQPTLVSLREIEDDLKAEQCNLQADVVLRIGDVETPWILSIETDFPTYDTDGSRRYGTFMYRADIRHGERQFELDVPDGWGTHDVEVITRQFGLDVDARVWRAQWNYANPDAQ